MAVPDVESVIPAGYDRDGGASRNRSIVRSLIPALEYLDASLSRKADEFASVVKPGRTHLMDATPVTLGQEFGGYAASVRLGVERLRATVATLPGIVGLPPWWWLLAIAGLGLAPGGAGSPYPLCCVSRNWAVGCSPN